MSTIYLPLLQQASRVCVAFMGKGQWLFAWKVRPIWIPPRVSAVTSTGHCHPRVVAASAEADRQGDSMRKYTTVSHTHAALSIGWPSGCPKRGWIRWRQQLGLRKRRDPPLRLARHATRPANINSSSTGPAFHGRHTGAAFFGPPPGTKVAHRLSSAGGRAVLVAPFPTRWRYGLEFEEQGTAFFCLNEL